MLWIFNAQMWQDTEDLVAYCCEFDSERILKNQPSFDAPMT